MAQGDYIELHRKRNGRKFDHEEKARKKEARKGNLIAKKAKTVRGIKAKLHNKKRYAEKAEMKKKIILPHHPIDSIDEDIIHLPRVGEGSTEAVDRLGITEMRVRGDEDSTAQIHVNPSERRLKLSHPVEVTATMSSTRIPPIAAE